MPSSFLELQIGADALALMVGVMADPSKLITKNVLTIGTDQYLVSDVATKSGLVLLYDTPTTFNLTYVDFYGSDTVQVAGNEVRMSEVLTVSLLKLVKDGAGNITGMVDGGSYDAEVFLLISTKNDTSTPAVSIVFSVDEVIPQFADLTFLPAIQTLLTGLVSSASSPLYTSVPIPPPQHLDFGAALNAGITAGPMQSFVAVRIEYSGVATQQFVQGTWNEFYRGNIVNHLTLPTQTLDWSVFVAGDLVANLVTGNTQAGLALHTDKMVLQGTILSVWAPDANGTVRVNSTYKADIFHACDGITDLNYNISQTVALSLGAPGSGALISTGHADWSASDQAVETLCNVAAGVEVGLLFAVGGAFLPTPFTAVIGFVVGFVLGFTGAFVFEAAYQPTLALPSTCTQTSGHDFQCTIPVQISAGTGSLPLQVAYGASDGMILGGGVLGLLSVRSMKLNLSPGSFRWVPPIVSCAAVGPDTMAKLAANMDGLAVAVCEIALTVVGQGQLQVWDVTVETPDPAGLVPAGAISVADYGGMSVVRVAVQPNAAYAANPYGVGLFIRSNGGAFFTNTGTVPALTPQIKNQLLAQAQSQLGQCTVAADPWWQATHQFNLNWLIDGPPPDGATVEHLIDIQVEGLGILEAIRLADEAGNTIATARANIQGRAVISHLAAGADLTMVPELSRISVGGSASTSYFGADGPTEAEMAIISKQRVRSRNVGVTYTEMIARATLGRGKPYKQIASGVFSGMPVLVTLAGERIDVVDVSYPSRPAFLAGMTVPAAGGLCTVGSGMVVWGQNGLALYGSGALRGRSIDKEPVIDAVVYGKFVAVLRRDRLDIYASDSLKLIEQHDASGASSVAATSRSVLVATARGIESYGAVGPCGLACVGFYPSTDVHALSGSPDIYPRTGIISSTCCGAAWMIDFANPQMPLRLGYFAQCPSIIDTVRIGSVSVRIASDRMSLVVSTRGRTLRTQTAT